MSEKELASLAVQCGYASKRQAIAWTKANPKEDYTDDDLNQLYLDLRSNYIHVTNRSSGGA